MNNEKISNSGACTLAVRINEKATFAVVMNVAVAATVIGIPITGKKESRMTPTWTGLFNEYMLTTKKK